MASVAIGLAVSVAVGLVAGVEEAGADEAGVAEADEDEAGVADAGVSADRSGIGRASAAGAMFIAKDLT